MRMPAISKSSPFRISAPLPLVNGANRPFDSPKQPQLMLLPRAVSINKNPVKSAIKTNVIIAVARTAADYSASWRFYAAWGGKDN